MIFGVGTDIAKVSRFEKWVRRPEMISRFFNACEIPGEGREAVSERQIHFLCEHYAARFAAKEAFAKAKPAILEPIMKVEIEGPSEFQGSIFGTVNQRRGMIVSSTEDGANCTVDAEVPLAEMFGYSTVLRSMTQGKAEYTMEVCRYAKVPQSIAEELKAKKEEKDKARK